MSSLRMYRVNLCRRAPLPSGTPGATSGGGFVGGSTSPRIATAVTVEAVTTLSSAAYLQRSLQVSCRYHV